jgi:hypothetical protein
MPSSIEISLKLVVCLSGWTVGVDVKRQRQKWVQSFDLDSVGLIPVIPNAHYVPSLLCHEQFNEASRMSASIEIPIKLCVCLIYVIDRQLALMISQ